MKRRFLIILITTCMLFSACSTKTQSETNPQQSATGGSATDTSAGITTENAASDTTSAAADGSTSQENQTDAGTSDNGNSREKANAENSDQDSSASNTADTVPSPTLLYQGHASLRIVTAEEKVIYIDPFAGEGYDLPADLILITHAHSDHTRTDLIKEQNPDCRIITQTTTHPNVSAIC